jgi:putative tricarboxylic transport membrane protein
VAALNPELELALMVVVGLARYAMRVYDFPIAPVQLGLSLGPMAETQLRRALAISQGEPLVLLQSPLSATLLVVAVLVLLRPTPGAACTPPPEARLTSGRS